MAKQTLAAQPTSGGQQTPEAPITPITPDTAPKKSTYTRWDAFDITRLNPTQIFCQGYHPMHPTDLSCHTRLPLQAQSMLDHLGSDHGGGFEIGLKVGDNSWKGWEQLSQNGVELEDLRCSVCWKSVRVNPSDIQNHMKPHPGSNKRMGTAKTFMFTISQAKKNQFEGFEEAE